MESSKRTQIEINEFREMCRRNLKRSFALRINYGFVRGEGHVVDGELNRAFKTMKEYREWCHRELPAHLGYKIVGRDGYDLERSTNKPLEWKGDIDEPEG